MLSPSFTITPAPRKPMPVTIPCTTRVASAGFGIAAPPYQKRASPTKTVSAADAMQTRPNVRIPAARPLVRTLAADQHAQ